jgi:hypothetical protein
MRPIALIVSSLLVLLAACGEKPQELAGGKVKGSAPGWQGPATPFTAPGWKPGDANSWEQHMQTRAQRGQNEYTRVGAGG